MDFFDAIDRGPGFATERLTAAELAEVRGLITAQYLDRIGEAAPALVGAARAAGVAGYHTLPLPFDHGTFWEKARRVLGPETVPAFERMGFFRRIRAVLPSAAVYQPDLMWRIVRPGQPGDIGPVHADKWFWDAGNGDLPAGHDRFKVWLAVHTEPGLNGLTVKPGSHLTDRWKRHVEERHGKRKPVLDEDEAALRMELLPLAPGELVLFHDGLLHGGAPNAGAACRVSLEMTVTYPAAEAVRAAAA